MNSISAGLAISVGTSATDGRPIFRAWLWTGGLAFATIAFWPSPAQVAVIEAWGRRNGYNMVAGTNDEEAKVVCDASGDVIVTGTSGTSHDDDQVFRHRWDCVLAETQHELHPPDACGE